MPLERLAVLAPPPPPIDNYRMLDVYKQSVLVQFEAALWMLHDCIQKCPDDRWSGPTSIIGKYEFWHVAHHTLACADYYLSRNKESFELLPQFYPAGQEDFENEYVSRLMTKDELNDFVSHCLAKLRESINAETEESLRGPNGFSKRFPRSELYLYNMRHVMHHEGQLSAFLRRAGQDPKWGYTGWPDAEAVKRGEVWSAT